MESNRLEKITVYCGSSLGSKPIYGRLAYILGQKIAERGYTTVYGGSNVGLMGKVADGALDKGGKVIGIIPEFLREKELQHENLTENYIVKDMHERKAMMNDMGDAFIALPGALGTMEELFESLTWLQLSLHKKPIGILNVNNFYKYFNLFIHKMIDEGFLHERYIKLFFIEEDIDYLLDSMEKFVPAFSEKW